MAKAEVEVERKFVLTPRLCKKLLSLSSDITEHPPRIDTYYDSGDYRLTRRGWWLRLRDQRWELKCRVNGKSGTETCHEEVEDAQEILRRLEISDGVLTHALLREHGLNPFASLTTERTTVRAGEFRIDMDESSADDGAFLYTVGEIELIVPEGQVVIAEECIASFCGRYGISNEGIRGKLIEYLSRHRPEHYEALVQAGVVNPSLLSATRSP